jgi:hypothetical protein
MSRPQWQQRPALRVTSKPVSVPSYGPECFSLFKIARMAEPRKLLFKGAQVRVKGSTETMIVSVASAKLAICHWDSRGEKHEGVFDVRTLERFSTGQQYDLWTVTARDGPPGNDEEAGSGIN